MRDGSEGIAAGGIAGFYPAPEPFDTLSRRAMREAFGRHPATRHALQPIIANR